MVQSKLHYAQSPVPLLSLSKERRDEEEYSLLPFPKGCSDHQQSSPFSGFGLKGPTSVCLLSTLSWGWDISGWQWQYLAGIWYEWWNWYWVCMACCVQELLISQLPSLLRGPRRLPPEKRPEMRDLREGSSLLRAGTKSKDKAMCRCGRRGKGRFSLFPSIILPRPPAGAVPASSPAPGQEGSPCLPWLCPTPATNNPSSHCFTYVCMCACTYTYINTLKASAGDRNRGTPAQLLSNFSELVAGSLLFAPRCLEIK